MKSYECQYRYVICYMQLLAYCRQVGLDRSRLQFFWIAIIFGLNLVVPLILTLIIDMTILMHITSRFNFQVVLGLGR